MNPKCIFCVLFYCIAFFSNKVHTFERNPIFISLGNNCWTAQALRVAGLRECAFPFDWLFSLDSEGLNKVFDDDFKYFTNKDFFSPDDYNRVAVRNNYYGMVFMHEWLFPDNVMTEESKPKVKKKPEPIFS